MPSVHTRFYLVSLDGEVDYLLDFDISGLGGFRIQKGGSNVDAACSLQIPGQEFRQWMELR